MKSIKYDYMGSKINLIKNLFKTKPKPAKIITYQKISRRESGLMASPLFVFPVILVAIFILSVVLPDFPYGILVSLMIIPWVIYTSIHQKSTTSDKSPQTHTESKVKKSSENFFQKIGYERAPLRYYNINKYLRYYLVVVIIILVLVSIGFYFIYQDEIVKNNEYKEQLNEYKKNKKNLASMNDDEIKEAFTALVYLKSEYDLKNIAYQKEYLKMLSTIEMDESELTYEQRYEIEQKARTIIDQLTAEKITSNAIDEIEAMTPIAMRLALGEEVERERPFLYSTRNLNWQQNFLVSSIITVGMVFVSLYITKMSLTRKSDFYYYLTISCFKTYEKFESLEQEEKRNYVLWGLEYYDSYIKSNHKKRIKNLDHIQSYIIFKPIEEVDVISKKILEKLENKDHLDLIRNLGNILENKKINTSLIYNDKKSETFKDRISLGLVLIPIISAIISIIRGYGV